jgi:sugar transferase (PEP-CTERM/EpsH1 system associated)
MNILFLSHRVPFPPNKGEKIRTFHQVKHLLEQGHTVSILAPYEKDQELAYFTALMQQFGVKAQGVKLGNKWLRMLSGLLLDNALSVSNFYSTSLMTLFKQECLEQDYDVIICTASSMAEYVFNSDLLSHNSLPNKPSLLMDFMDLDSDKWQQYCQRATFPMNLIYKREATLIARYEKKIFKHFNDCFFITETEKALFCEDDIDASHVHAIENGIDTDTFKPNPVRRIQAHFLFTGVMDYAPNIDAVMWFVQHIWPAIIERWPVAQFNIVGMDPTDKVKALSQVDGIHVSGFVDDVMPYFDNSAIFVAPFRIARGVQNKVLQAFACGLPVVSTLMGAEGIRCEDQHDILLAEQPAEFVTHIAALLADEHFYHKISANALETIKAHYAWKSVLAPLDTVLQNQLIQHSVTADSV